MSTSPSLKPITGINDQNADDVALAQSQGTLWIAWSSATQDTEQVMVAHYRDGEWSKHVPITSALGCAFRPTVAPLASGVLFCASVKNADGYRPAFLWVPHEGKARRWIFDCEREVYQIALAAVPGQDYAWIAWEERRGPEMQIRFGRIGPDGKLERWEVPKHAKVWRRSPVIAATNRTMALGWVEGGYGEGGRVLVSRLGSQGFEPAKSVDPNGAYQDAPSITICPSGSTVVAWHSGARGERGGDLIRWLRVAQLESEARHFKVIPTDPVTPRRLSAGEDQGWEFPSVAVDADSHIWLAGRSSHNFYVSQWQVERGWSDRASVSPEGWGGRGRLLSMVIGENGHPLVARRNPDGIAIDELERPTEDRIPDSDPVRRETTVLPGPIGRQRNDVLFGDLHQHTAHSDGIGTPEEILHISREARALDFAAITDHDRFCRRAIGPATWQYLCEVTEAFHEPGRFVALHAYEFTGARHPGPGHKCIFFGDSWPDRVPAKDIDAVFNTLREYGGIAVPHHVGWTGADIQHHDPELQPVWEICSVHGCYERCNAEVAFPPRKDVVLPDQFVKNALDAGLRFGFIGSTDSHGLLWHHGVSPKRDPYSTGLAAMVGAERTRDSILKAMAEKRTYATTGARIILQVELDGAPMGSELPADAKGKLGIRIEGSDRLAQVSVVSSSSEIPIEVWGGGRCEVSIPLRLPPDKTWEYFYLRVEQTNTEMAWSSPIWIGKP